jgi:hypothetical protein
MEASMKTLVSVAVFGLVPIPTMTDTRIIGRDDARATDEFYGFPRLMFVPRLITERMATKEELACIRDELEKIAAEAARPARSRFIKLTY